MPVLLVALLLASEFITTAPPASHAGTQNKPAPPAATAPVQQGVVGVDLPAYPRPARPSDRPAPPPAEGPSPELGFRTTPMLGQESTATPPPPAPAAEKESRCRKRETPNGFIYSCGDPAATKPLEEQTERMLNDLLSPR